MTNLTTHLIGLSSMLMQKYARRIVHDKGSLRIIEV